MTLKQLIVLILVTEIFVSFVCIMKKLVEL